MKLLVIGPWSSGHIQQWIKLFKDSYSVTVITLHPERPKDEAVKFISLPTYTGTRLDFLINIPKLRSIVASINPDLIHVHFLSSYGIMASFIPQRYKKILSIWGTDVNGKIQENPALRKLASNALKTYDFINLPAKHFSEKLNKICKIDHSKIFVFQYGVDTNILPRAKMYPRENDILKLASIRNWAMLYHIDDLLKGYRHYCDENHKKKSCLYLFGNGSPQDISRVNALVKQLSFPEGSIKVVGFIDRNSLFEKLKEMDIVISIPDKDGAPLSLMESIYIGIYPIVSDLEANREWLDNDCATFINDYSSNAISTAIYHAEREIKNPMINDSIKKSRNKVIIEGDYVTNMEATKEIYKRIHSS